jgi:sulfur-oxidizing protein SoxX
MVSHDILPDWFDGGQSLPASSRLSANAKPDRHLARFGDIRRFRAHREDINATFRIQPSTLSADGVYALTTYIHQPTLRNLWEAPLIHPPSRKPVPMPALALALLIGAVASASPASAQSAAEGQKLAFDRGKGNCLTCHEIKGGDLPGTIGPALKDIKSKYPDRNELVAILYDETKRNPQTVMPPFGRNRILTEKEINAIVDFLQTL